MQRDEDIIDTIRPSHFDDFVGQKPVCKNLKVFIEASKLKKEALDHVLLYGPPGLGKTTLAKIIATERNVNIKEISGPALTKSGDLAAILTNLNPYDVLFIDEIHRLNISVEELLYSAMEDFKIDIIIGEGPAAKSITLDLPKFTLVGATTRAGLLTQPLRERFLIPLRLQFYEEDELVKIIKRASSIFNIEIEEEGAYELARCSRGTPRICGRLIRRIRDFATVNNVKVINKELVQYALKELNVNALGLDLQDLKYIKSIQEFYNGGPVGIETLAAVLSEQKDTIEDIIEPYLIQKGLVKRTSRGRVLTDKGSEYFLAHAS
ncbi:MAG: Holliday junction branch migration DNA helicase RuvB [Alphaproteobacteria bacterium]|nr:MAG: Holliday junction branch migration DNA helicase RuvB [Alphaproteobacteria bacterium]